MALSVAVIASLLLAAAPVAATTTTHYEERGSGLNAYFSNVVLNDEGWIDPGRYFETYVDAATYMARNDGSSMYQYVCVGHSEFTIDDEGNWIDEGWFGACGEAIALTVDRRLGSGHVSAIFEAEECLVWDDDSKDCTQMSSLGEVVVDLTMTGTGRIQRWHGTSSGGTAGAYQYTSHGNGTSRNGDPSGTVTLGGASLIEGSTFSAGWMFQSKSGYVDIWHD